MTNYFTFFLMDKFEISVQGAQYCLFTFLGASAVGTVAGGPLGDRFGRKYVIWGSILGAAPFTLLLPYANLTCTIVLAVIIGLVISSAFSAILVYATDLMPGKVGMVARIFRADVRPRRPRLGLLRLAGRQDQHRIHLSDQHPAAPVGDNHGFPAEYRRQNDKHITDESMPNVIVLRPRAVAR